jgi:hypothetical protein
MSILSSVTSILEPTSIPGSGVPREDCKPADDCGDDKQSKWNDDHKGRDDDHKGGRDDYSKHAKNDDDHKGRDDDHKGRNEHSKHAKNDDDCSKDGKDDYSKHDGGWKDAKTTTASRRRTTANRRRTIATPSRPTTAERATPLRTRVKCWPGSTSPMVI